MDRYSRVLAKCHPKFVSNNTKIYFKAYLFIQLMKNSARNIKPKAITVLKKEGERGGGPARYDNDHRYNGVFYPVP